MGWFCRQKKSEGKDSWAIVNLDTEEVFETFDSPRKARRAQKRWHNSWVWHGGPQTTIVPIRPETVEN